MRELRNQGAEVVERAQRGERLTITRAGKPVAQLVGLDRPPAALADVRRRWSRLPDFDPADLRRDLDELIDPAV